MDPRSLSMSAARRRPRGLVPGALALLVTAALAGPSSAQDGDDLRVELRGQVFDQLTGQPLHGAFVASAGSDTGVLTDESGMFTLRVARSSTAYALSVENLGYVDTQFAIDAAEAESGAIVMRIEPNPVVLEGFRVLADRFQRRRRAAAVSARAFDRTALLHSTAFDAAEHVQFQSGVSFTPCAGTLDRCVLSRGRRVRPVVYIDEVRAIGGLDQLATYRPQDLYLLEVYARGRMIRAYTEWFMERHAERGRLFPLPIFF